MRPKNGRTSKINAAVTINTTSSKQPVLEVNVKGVVL